MRKSIATILCAAMMAAIAFSGSAVAENSVFKISDYIPDRLQDLRWRVGGGADLSGYEDEEGTLSPVNQYDWQEHLDWRLNLDSYLEYRYQTIPRFLNADLSIRGSSRFSDTDSKADRVNDDYYETETRRDVYSHYSTYTTRLGQSVDAGQYLLGDWFVSGLVAGSFSYREDPDDTTHSSSYTRRLYWNSNREVWEEYSSESINDSRAFELSADFLPGWGRFYSGRYAAAAMYMIEELRKNNALLREPTPDEMRALCDTIYQRREVHDIDLRLGRIEAFDQIFSFLNERGITDPANHYGHLLIQDVWDYFPRDERNFGLMARVGPGIDYEYSRSRRSQNRLTDVLQIDHPLDTTDAVDTLTRLTHTYSYSCDDRRSRDVYMKGLVEYSRPISLKWQLDIVGCALYYFDSYSTHDDWYIRVDEYDDRSDTREDITETRTEFSKRYLLALAPTLAYIPNSRTRADFSAYYGYSRRASEAVTRDLSTGEVTTEVVDEILKSFELEGRLSYRISIPTSVGLSARYLHHSPGITYRENLGPFFADDVYRTTFPDYRNTDQYSVSLSVTHYLY